MTRLGWAEVYGVRQVRAEVHFTVNIDEEDGCYWAEIVEIPGFFVWGRSMQEIRDALAEAVHATVHSTGAQVVFRDLASLAGDGVAAASTQRAPSRSGGRAAGRLARHPVLSAIPNGPVASDEGTSGEEDDGPLADLVSLAGRRPAQS